MLPKGGWETDEATEQDAAAREAWEEAGIIVKITYDLGHIEEKRVPSQTTAEAPTAKYRFYEAIVDKMEESFPEMHKRTRKWMTYSQAAVALKDRPELLEALSKCTMNRT